MKKIIITVTIILMSFSTMKADQPFNHHVIGHVNPMPNLMRVVKGNADILKISEEQMKSVMQWGKKSKPEMKKAVKLIMSEEKRLMDDALSGDSDSVKESEAMLEARKNIISIKTNCRKNLKSILSKEQYEQVLNIYKSMK